MQVHFKSINDDYQIDFISEAIQEGNEIIFFDKSMENTKIIVEVKSDTEILLKRTGQTNMSIVYKLNQITYGNYANTMGLKFDFAVMCQKMTVKKNNIFFVYDYYMDNILQSSHKIWIIIK